jgi:[lysine-biosynthesis-protein LysW]---L-2-aminoadipate ligase
MRIGLLHSRVRPEERMLFDAAIRSGVDSVPIHVDSLVLDASCAEPSAPFRGLDAVLDRCLSHSRGLALLRVLEGWGIPCCNSWSVRELCGDKLATNVALARAGVPVPRAQLGFGEDGGLAAVEALGYPAVIKPLVGSWGRLLARLNDRDAAEALIEHKVSLGSTAHGVVFAQEHVEKGGRDLRVFVVGDRVACAIARRSDHWVTNTARGASVEAHAVDAELEALSLSAARAVGGGAVAIDIFESERGLLVNEVNATMEFRNSVAPTGVDLPSLLVRHTIDVARSAYTAALCTGGAL